MIIEQIEKEFLFEGYQAHFENLVSIPDYNRVSDFPVVLGLNNSDFVMSQSGNLNITNFELSGWNPMAMDLAHYINSAMLDSTTCHSDNLMSRQEIHSMAEQYLNDYWDKHMLDIVRENYFDKAYFIHLMKN